jgi:hypothetical protein
VNELLITVAIAAAFLMLALWSRREIAAGQDSDLRFIDHDIPTGPIQSRLRWLVIKSKTTLYFALAVLILGIGTLRYFEVIQ